MRKMILVLLAVGIMAITVTAQDDSLAVVMKSLHQNLNSLEKVITENNLGNKNSYELSNLSSGTMPKMVFTDLGHGDYYERYSGIFAGGGFNTTETFVSTIAFNHLESNISYLSAGYVWNSESRKWNDRNWWLTKTFSRKTAISFNWFNTNEYTASLSGDYVAKFAHNLLSLGCNFDGGVYSSVIDSIMKPYLYGGINGSIFCLYGSVGLYYSKYIKYESLYNFAGNFIPIYEFGVKTPPINIKKISLVLKTVYCNYAVYQPKSYTYDDNGKIVEDLSKKIFDTDLIKISVSALDHYGNLLQLGFSTWDKKNLVFGLSAQINLNSIL